MILFGCLFGMFAAFAPRLALLFYWIARPAVVNAAFNTFIFPCLGIIFLPFSTLMWVLLYTPGIGITGGDWLWLALAVVLDIYGGVTGGRYAWLNRSNVPGASKTGASV